MSNEIPKSVDNPAPSPGFSSHLAQHGATAVRSEVTFTNDRTRAAYRRCDLPAFFGPVITGEQRQLKFVVRLRVLP